MRQNGKTQVQVRLIESKLFTSACLLQIHIRCWSNSKKFSVSEIMPEDVSPMDGNIDRGRLRGSKTLVECPEYDAVVDKMYGAKAWCDERCMPSYIAKGLRFIALTVEQMNGPITWNVEPEKARVM